MELNEDEWKRVFADWVPSQGAEKLAQEAARELVTLFDRFVKDERQIGFFGDAVGVQKNMNELERCSLDSFGLIAEVAKQWGQHLNIWETRGKQSHQAYESLLVLPEDRMQKRYLKVQTLFKKQRTYSSLVALKVNFHKDEKSRNTDQKERSQEKKDLYDKGKKLQEKKLKAGVKRRH